MHQTQKGHAAFFLSFVCPCMEPATESDELSSRIELFEAAATKSEKALARHRELLADLRIGGCRTSEAEEMLQKYEASYRRLKKKLSALKILASLMFARSGPGANTRKRSPEDVVVSALL